MGKLIKEEPNTGRLHIDSPLMGESLVSKELLKRTESGEYFRMHPDINVIKIGGPSMPKKFGHVFSCGEDDNPGQHPFDGLCRNEFLAARAQIHSRHATYSE